MKHQYFLKGANLEKVELLEDYLVNEENFTSENRDIKDRFLNKFNPNKWENEGGTAVFIYTEKYGIFIETNSLGNEETSQNLDLVREIYKITNTQEIFNGAGTSLDKTIFSNN